MFVLYKSYSFSYFLINFNICCIHFFYLYSFQACGMFLGEFSCFITFYILLCIERKKSDPSERDKIGPQKFNPVIFLVPALCDLTATSTMYVGLNLTYASSFQMLRGEFVFVHGSPSPQTYYSFLLQGHKIHIQDLLIPMGFWKNNL